MLFRDYGAQFVSIIAGHKSLAKFGAKRDPEGKPSSLSFPGKILVCTEDGQVRPGFTDPDERRYLARNPSEVHTIVFIRETKAKVTIAAGGAPVLVAEGMGVPTQSAIQVTCHACAVSCDSKSVLGEDVFQVDPMAGDDSVDVAASGGTGMVALEIAKWIERNVRHTDEY